MKAPDALPDDFVLTARCEHLLWGETSLVPVIEHLQALDAAGADVLYAPGLHSLEAMGQVCAAVTKPVNTVIEMPSKPFSLAEIAMPGSSASILAPSLRVWPTGLSCRRRGN